MLHLIQSSCMSSLQHFPQWVVWVVLQGKHSVWVIYYYDCHYYSHLICVFKCVPLRSISEEFKVPDGMVGFSMFTFEDSSTESHKSLFVLLDNLCKMFSLLLVIGRGGEQISRLQQESGCKIQIAPGKCCCWCFSLISRNHSFTFCLMDHMNLCYRQRRNARQVGHVNGATWVNPVSNPNFLLKCTPSDYGYNG